MSKKAIISVRSIDVTVLTHIQGDYVLLTDMAKDFGNDVLIYSWMKNRNSLEFLRT